MEKPWLLKKIYLVTTYTKEGPTDEKTMDVICRKEKGICKICSSSINCPMGKVKDFTAR